MKLCGTCQLFTLHFPTGFKSDYYRSAGIGRCKLEPVSKVRAPSSGKECGKYQEAEDVTKRIEWMNRRRK